MNNPVLTNAFVTEPEETLPVRTEHRRILTSLPAPETLECLRECVRLFPEVTCYPPPIVWDRADGYQVFDRAGNCWIDFSSTAVMTNTGHGHPAIRETLKQHVSGELLAQFCFPSELISSPHGFLQPAGMLGTVNSVMESIRTGARYTMRSLASP